uniref:Uncharacterized protein n=1 Tax=Panagrolaimus sp. PS1159 TaxID=55785 RepID=A0AC35F6Z5_9BILA
TAETKREESKEPIDDETKRAAAISEINSARGKLQKQRTLERVRIFATSGTTSFDKTVEEPDTNGVEKEICLIIEHVVPWLNKNENEKVTPKFVTELRELIIGMANKICFPAGVNSDLFKTQLTTIL